MAHSHMATEHNQPTKTEQVKIPTKTSLVTCGMFTRGRVLTVMIPTWTILRHS